MVLLQLREILQILNINRSRFNYIAQKVGIRADIKQASGPGTMNIYSFEALMLFAIANLLVVEQFRHKRIKEIISKIDGQDNTFEVLKNKYLFIKIDVLKIKKDLNNKIKDITPE